MIAFTSQNLILWKQNIENEYVITAIGHGLLTLSDELNYWIMDMHTGKILMQINDIIIENFRNVECTTLENDIGYQIIWR